MTYDHTENKKLYCQDWQETNEPWLRWEKHTFGTWVPLTRHPYWGPEREYRRIDPYRALKEAAADPTKQIRCNLMMNAPWRDGADGREWEFIHPVGVYEIRDKPTEPVKYLCYESRVGGNLYWLREGVMTPNHDALRVPEFDKVLP